MSCVVKSVDGSACTIWQDRSDRNPSNMEGHIFRFHSADGSGAAEQLCKMRDGTVTGSLKKDGPSKKVSGFMKQVDLRQSFEKPYDRKKTYDRNKIQRIQARMVLWVASNPHQPYSTPENPEFRSLIRELNPRFECMSRRTLARLTLRLYANLKIRLQERIDAADKVSICTDLWTAITGAPFLAYKVHFFDAESGTPVSHLLALRKAPHPHTGERIADAFFGLCREFNLSPDKIFRILTDGGANVVRGFSVDLARRFAMERDQSDEFEKQIRAELDDTLSFEAVEEEFDDVEKSMNKKFGGKKMSCFVHNTQCKFSLNYSHKPMRLNLSAAVASKLTAIRPSP